MLENMFTGKSISRAGKGVVRAGRCYDMDYIGKSV